jgi:transposase
MKKPIEIRQKVILNFSRKKISKQKAALILNCSTRTVERYLLKFQEKGKKGLTDNRHSNNHKLTEKDKDKIYKLKFDDRWRSSRNIRDELNLKVGETTVGNFLRSKGLSKQNIERVKPILRFEAALPNDLWQTDIMGKINFPNVGTCYLIATLDDHSRFCLSGRFFKTQGKMNVFQVWYESLSRWGLPKAMLQDEGSQYKARVRFGQADYEFYAKALKIELIWAHRAQTKGKIERFWKFVQGDFVRSVWNVKTIEEVNGAFRVWLARYNYKFKSRYFGETRISRYKASERRLPGVELQTILTVEERRKVTRESTISLYGKHYFVPPGYIGCHIWVKVKGNKVCLEANGETFWKTKLKLF